MIIVAIAFLASTVAGMFMEFAGLIRGDKPVSHAGKSSEDP